MESSKGGRPRKFNNAIQKIIISSVSEGLTLKAACREAGISYSTLANWRQKYRNEMIDSNLKEDYQFISLLDSFIDQTAHEHRQKVKENRKPKDYRHGWKNPMRDETKEKLRLAAYEKIIEKVLARAGVIIG